MISEPGGRRAATSAVSAATTTAATEKGFKGYYCYSNWNEVEGSTTAKFTPNTDIRCNWVNQHEISLFISLHRWWSPSKLCQDFLYGYELMNIAIAIGTHFKEKVKHSCIFDINGSLGVLPHAPVLLDTFQNSSEVLRKAHLLFCLDDFEFSSKKQFCNQPLSFQRPSVSRAPPPSPTHFMSFEIKGLG